jgi:hypothetical protein
MEHALRIWQELTPQERDEIMRGQDKQRVGKQHNVIFT